jgi:hypothetical protein
MQPPLCRSNSIMVKNMLPYGRWRTAAALLLSVACGGALAATVSGPPAHQAEPVVMDWRTGDALHGVDPVTYFIDGAPGLGLEAFELGFAGATWRFRNSGNREAFVADPQVYRPRFGGHDPVALGRGVATPGNPQVWLMFAGVVHLFHDPDSRDAFRAAPQKILAAADARWPQLAEQVSQGDFAPTVTPPQTSSPSPPPDPLWR